MDYQEIRDLIANARKRTPVQAFVRHRHVLNVSPTADLQVYPTGAGTTILIGEWAEVTEALAQAASQIEYYHLDNDRRNSAIPLLDLKGINARIEPGAVIRDKVEIGERAIIMMGAVINTTGGELTPFLSRDGRTLLWSATMTARPSLGRQDIWMSTRTPSGQ